MQSANGNLVLKGTNDVVVPTTTVTMPLTSSFVGNKTTFPKIQLVKATTSNMILMQKVANPFGSHQGTGPAIKDGRPFKMNVLQPKITASVLPSTPVVVQPIAKPFNLSHVQITEDTPVDISPAENMIIDTQPSIITSNHIIVEANAGSTLQQHKNQPMRVQPIEAKQETKHNVEPISTTLTTSEVIEPTDWEEQLDQQNTKAVVVAATTASMDELIEEDGEGVVAGYMTSEETNDDDIIQYEGGEFRMLMCSMNISNLILSRLNRLSGRVLVRWCPGYNDKDSTTATSAAVGRSD